VNDLQTAIAVQITAHLTPPRAIDLGRITGTIHPKLLDRKNLFFTEDIVDAPCDIVVIQVDNFQELQIGNFLCHLQMAFEFIVIQRETSRRSQPTYFRRNGSRQNV
jgi:hypothetical protein